MGKLNNVKINSADAAHSGHDEPAPLTLSLVEEPGVKPDIGTSPEQSEQTPVSAEISPAAAAPVKLPTTDGAATTTAFACPKCKTEQAKSDECINCGIIISKYQHPRDRIKAGRAASKRVEMEADGGFFSSWAFKGAMVALLAVTAAFFFTGRSEHSTVGNTASGPQYSVTAHASEKTKRLLDISDSTDSLDEISVNLTELFARVLPDKAKSRGTSPANIELILSQVPNAFNANAAKATLGNWIDMQFSESEIDALLKIYETPSVERFVEAGRQFDPAKRKVEFETFIADLQNSPLSDSRTRALGRLVDTVTLDEMMLAALTEGHISVIKMSAAAIKNPDSMDVQQKTNREIEEMRDMLGWMKAELRAHAIGALAWQLQNFSTSDINMLNKAVDKPVHKAFMRESTRAFKEVFAGATLWLRGQVRIDHPR